MPSLPWFANASDADIDAHPAAAQIRSDMGSHTSPQGHQYRLVDHGSSRFVTAHYLGKNGTAKPTHVGSLSWFGGKADRSDTSNISGGRIYGVAVKPAHQRRGVASAMLDFAREKHPDHDIRHSDALSEDGQAWADKKASRTHQPLTFEAFTRSTMDQPLPFEAFSHLSSLRTVAHDSGDGESIYHCPFCGSGQVIARSDKSTECQFCHTSFTVQVQPQFSAFPQTINGMPVQVPGMPGQVQPPPDPMAQDPNADPNADPDAQQPDEDPDDSGNPFAKGSSLRTESGYLLSPEDYMKRLALRHADDRAEVLEQARRR